MVIGGAGERKTLRVVARHADEWNWSGGWSVDTAPEEFARLSGILDQHCEAIGRDPNQIRRSLQLFIQPEDDAQLRGQLSALEEYERRGVDHVVLVFTSPPSPQLLASVAPG
jgi:alkanesulfonate monooxygenase SsuD/methylene tetrahydromethanopterin reductase-like flavin-dependent oxidoreductase (luciferase family)